MDWDKMSNLYRGPSIDASYQSVFFSSPCQRQFELLPSLGIRRLLTFHILIFSSETPQPNELKLGNRKQIISNKFSNSDYKITRRTSLSLVVISQITLKLYNFLLLA
jgi:hypothetical protein